MASFDDAMKNAVPGGNLATPDRGRDRRARARQALWRRLLARAKRAASPGARASSTHSDQCASRQHSGRTDRPHRQADRRGAAPQVNSWIGPGENQPIQPGQLGGALGQNVLNELSARTGMSQQELLNQLVVALPQIINSMTPKGRMPTLADLDQK